MEVFPGTYFTDYVYPYPTYNTSLRFIEVQIVIKETIKMISVISTITRPFNGHGPRHNGRMYKQVVRVKVWVPFCYLSTEQMDSTF